MKHDAKTQPMKQAEPQRSMHMQHMLREFLRPGADTPRSTPGVNGLRLRLHSGCGERLDHWDGQRCEQCHTLRPFGCGTLGAWPSQHTPLRCSCSITVHVSSQRSLPMALRRARSGLTFVSAPIHDRPHAPGTRDPAPMAFARRKVAKGGAVHTPREVRAISCCFVPTMV